MGATNSKSCDVSIIMSPKWDHREPWTAPAYVCQYLRHLGLSVEFHDFNIQLFNICKEIGFEHIWKNSAYHQAWLKGDLNFLSGFLDLKQIRGDVVGFSCVGTNRSFSLHLANEIRLRHPKKKIIMGGHDLYFESDVGTINNRLADAICKGEGEHTLRDVMERGCDNLESVPGLYIPNGNGWKLTEDRPLIKDLNEIPWPTFEEIDDLGVYEVQDLPLTASRGCIAKCIFCNDRIRTPNYRTRSAISQVDELQYLKERYDTEFFIYNDPLMNGNLKIMRDKAEEIIRRGLKLEYGGNIMVHPRMTDDMFPLLGKSGLTVSILGIESGSPTTLKNMRKYHDRDMASAFIRKCKNAGMRVELNLIVGFPTETEEHFQETLSFLSENSDYIDCIVSAATFNVAYSDLWHCLDEFEIVTHPESIHNSWHTKDMSNTLDVRLDRLSRLIDHAANLDIMNVRTDYEIEEGTPVNASKFLKQYMSYWNDDAAGTDEQRDEALSTGRIVRKQMQRQRLKHKALEACDKIGMRRHALWLRHQLRKIGVR